MNPKLFLIFLVLFVVLFVAGAGVGFFADDGPPALDIRSGDIKSPAWLGGIGNLLPSGIATFEDLTGSNDDAACFDRPARSLTVPPFARCWYTLSTAARPRSLTLKLVTGIAADVELHQPAKENGSIGARETFTSGGEHELDLFPRQSETDLVQLRVFCSDLETNCLIEILE